LETIFYFGGLLISISAEFFYQLSGISGITGNFQNRPSADSNFKDQLDMNPAWAGIEPSATNCNRSSTQHIPVHFSAGKFSAFGRGELARRLDRWLQMCGRRSALAWNDTP
jgi:hypothetical protein